MAHTHANYLSCTTQTLFFFFRVIAFRLVDLGRQPPSRTKAQSTPRSSATTHQPLPPPLCVAMHIDRAMICPKRKICGRDGHAGVPGDWRFLIWWALRSISLSFSCCCYCYVLCFFVSLFLPTSMRFAVFLFVVFSLSLFLLFFSPWAQKKRTRPVPLFDKLLLLLSSSVYHTYYRRLFFLSAPKYTCCMDVCFILGIDQSTNYCVPMLVLLIGYWL